MQNVIIAFDSKQLTLILEKMLGSFGFDTTKAENTEQIRVLLKKGSKILLLSDWNLAGQSMIDFLSRIENKPTTIFISKENSPEKIITALQNGIDEYIIKPFDNDILQSKLSMVGLL